MLISIVPHPTVLDKAVLLMTYGRNHSLSTRRRPLCLISDPWIPVFREGQIAVIRPDQIAEPGVSRLAWSRPDFNLACIEFLVGLVSMAAPPKDETEWYSRLILPNPGQLRETLTPFAANFMLSGGGPRFLQDIEAFEVGAKPSEIRSVNTLYIDSAGISTEKKNSDLMVKRGRFSRLAPAEAAMALYTLQAFAPAGGAGNRTSMRGGGPLVTLIRPIDREKEKFSLWRLVFANVTPGLPLQAKDAEAALPWLRPTRTSSNNEVLIPSDSHPLEAFFGMPRRLRLVFQNDMITGVVQKRHGTNYSNWEHPLTPYYRQKEDDPEWLPVHPTAGHLSYRNWLGITIGTSMESSRLRRLAKSHREYRNRSSPPDCEITAGGWAMDNMTPVDFLLDRYPAFPELDEEREIRVKQLVDAANAALRALEKALRDACKLTGATAKSLEEAFYSETEAKFAESVKSIAEDKGIDSPDTRIEESWFKVLRSQTERMYDERATAGLADLDPKSIAKRIAERRILIGELARKVRMELGLPVQSAKGSRK